MYSRTSHHNTSLPLRLLLLVAVLLACLTTEQMPTLHAQSDISSIDIVRIDASAFPTVTVQARIRDSAGMPITEFNPESFILTEDDSQLAFEYRAIDAGVQVALVADLGAGSSTLGATAQPRIEEIRSLITSYIESMGPNDEALILQMNENGTTILQEMTSDTSSLLAAAEALTAERTASRLTNGYGAVEQALNTLAQQSADKAQAVILFSTGIQLAGPVTFEDAGARALDLGIPVHTVLANSTDIPLSYNLQRLSEVTGGQYMHYVLGSDLQPIIDVIDEHSQQYELTYRSTSREEAERTVTLETRGGGPNAPRDFETYQVDLAAPRVVIDEPEDNAVFVREAGEIGQPLDEVEPREVTITAHVEWPDGYPRELVSAQLLVDEQAYGEALVEPGSTMTFTWDIRPYREEGDNRASLEVQVADELGFTATSAPSDVTVRIVIPEEVPVVEQTCQEAAGSNIIQQLNCALAGFNIPLPVLIAVPLVLLALLVWQGKGLLLGIVRILDRAFVGFFRRITHPVEETPAPPPEASAYLVVIKGTPELEGMRFPLYAGHITPIGRDAEQAEILLNGEASNVVGRKHCEIRYEDGRFKLRDFASMTGTFLNGARLPELAIEPLEDGDEIAVGPPEEGGVVLRFETVRPSRPTSLRR